MIKSSNNKYNEYGSSMIRNKEMLLMEFPLEEMQMCIMGSDHSNALKAIKISILLYNLFVF